MAGPNELRFNEAVRGGNAENLRNRATHWRNQAKALTEAAADIRKARSDVEPYYEGTTDAAAAREAMTTFAKGVEIQRDNMLHVAHGLDDAAETMENAQKVSLGHAAPDAPTGKVTPDQQKDYQQAKDAAYAAREAQAKHAYNDLVAGYSTAAAKISKAAPSAGQKSSEGGSGSGGGGGVPTAPTSTTAPVATGFALTSTGGRKPPHVIGYSTDATGSTVDLSPTGTTGAVGQVTGSTAVPAASTDQVTGGTASGSVLGNPVQAGGGATAAGAALAGGTALAKGTGALRSALAGRAAGAASKPTTLGASARSGARSVLGRANPAAARGAAGSAAGKATGAARATGAKATGAARATGAKATGAARATGAKATGATRATGAKATGATRATGAKATGATRATGAKATGATRATGAKATGAARTGTAKATGATRPTGARATAGDRCQGDRRQGDRGDPCDRCQGDRCQGDGDQSRRRWSDLLDRRPRGSEARPAVLERVRRRRQGHHGPGRGRARWSSRQLHRRRQVPARPLRSWGRPQRPRGPGSRPPRLRGRAGLARR